MARRGRFGRLPRSAPNLTNTLVSIAREMQSQRDSNLMSAWQKGGLFEGQKATDELVLKHWSNRMDKVAKDDPLYDTYKNAYVQYDYSIHESKATVAYAQGKMTDGQMAQFYLNWAKKVPKSSEFWRVLQRDGAQFMRASKAKSAAAGKAAAEKAYQDAQNGTHQTKEAGGEYLLTTLRALAQRGQADYGIGPLIGAPGSNSDLTDFDASDPEQMLRLLGLITPTGEVGSKGNERLGEATANERVLMHDDQGKPITGASIVAAMKKLDKGFDGTLDLTYVKGAIKTQLAGVQERIDRAEKTGHASDVSQLRNQMEYVGELGRLVSAAPVEQDYMHLRATFESQLNNPSAMPSDKQAAWTKYQAGLMNLSDDPRISADDNFRSRLVAEAELKDGAPTLLESFTGRGETNGSQDISRRSNQIAMLGAQTDAVANGQALWTTGNYDKDGYFTPVPGGSSVGAAPYETIAALSPVPPTIMLVPNASGKAQPVVVTGTEVTVKANFPDGKRVNTTDNKAVASVYQVTVNGQTRQVFSFETDDGAGGKMTMFSTDPPWDTNRIKMSTTSSGIELDASALVPEPGPDGRYPEGGAWKNQKESPNGQAYLTLDTKAGVLGSDSMRQYMGGFDPATDFFSPTIAALSDMPDGFKILTNMYKDPKLKDQIDADARKASGQVLGPDNIWTGGNLALYGKFQQQVALTQQSANAEGQLRFFVDSAQALWSRSQLPSSTGQASKDDFFGPRDAQMGEGGKLATDLLQGTPFAALGKLFVPGTNNIKPSERTKDDAVQIKTATQIKVPTIAPSSITPTPGPAPGPAPTPTPTSMPQFGPPVPSGSTQSQASFHRPVAS